MSQERRIGARAEQKRRWDRQDKDLCSCGQLKKLESENCYACYRALQKDAQEERRQFIVFQWHAGRSLKQIARALNSTPAAVGVEMARMRAEGYDLPYRYRLKP